MAGYFTDNFWIALVCAFVAGALTALIYAVLTVTLMANQNVIGLALTIFGVGLSNFIGVFVLNKTQAGSLKLPEQITSSMRMTFFDLNIFVYIGVVLAVILEIWMKKTKTGLNLRAIGENPDAADAAGISVNRWKYISILVGGGICGIGGAYCALIINSGVWISDVIGGLGWISVALVIFASWDFIGAVVGSMLFGALRVLKYYIPTSVLPLPNAFYDMLPFLMTAIILIIGSMRKNKKSSMPGYLGNNYFRENR
jgi:simple sugar transport system permease protein